jgi:hypothetical protein
VGQAVALVVLHVATRRARPGQGHGPVGASSTRPGPDRSGCCSPSASVPRPRWPTIVGLAIGSCGICSGHSSPRAGRLLACSGRSITPPMAGLMRSPGRRRRTSTIRPVGWRGDSRIGGPMTTVPWRTRIQLPDRHDPGRIGTVAGSG